MENTCAKWAKWGNGNIIKVPSYIYDTPKLVSRIESVGFKCLKFEHAFLKDITEDISPKLLFEKENDYPIVTGYIFTKE